MPLSYLLALAMLMNSPSGAKPLSQDTSKPESGTTQSTQPPAEPAKGEVEKKQAPAEAAKSPEEAKKPDESQKTDEPTKASEAEKGTTANQPTKKTPSRRDSKNTPPGEPRKVVIRRGGSLEPGAQISPDIPPEEALKLRQKAEEMLVAAEDRLKLLAGRTLGPPQQETTTQIRNFMDKARSALREGDAQRGHTLALKAYLLADDLVRH